MSTIGLRRNLLLSFPELSDVRFNKVGARITFYAIFSNDRVDDKRIEQWINKCRPAGISICVTQVREFPPNCFDPEERALTIPAALDLLEDTNTNLPELLVIFNKLFPDYVYDLEILNFDGKCVAEIKVNPKITGETETGIRTALDLMLYCEVDEYHFSELMQPIHSIQIILAKYSAPDMVLMFDNVERVLHGESLPEFEPLPNGSSVVIGGYHSIQSLSYMISMFDNVYIKIPRSPDDFQREYGYPFEDFLEILPSQRLIPLFFHQPERYDRAVIDSIDHSEIKRILRRGEIFLRVLHLTCALDPLLSALASYDEDGRKIQAHILSSNDLTANTIRPYFEHIGDCIARIRQIGKSGESAMLGDFSLMPYAFVEHVAVERLLSLSEASFYGKLTSSLNAMPVCIREHPFEDYLDTYGSLENENSNSLQRIDPQIIGELLLVAKGIPLKDLVYDFDSENTRRMRDLISSPRLLSAPDVSKVIEEFNLEAREFNSSWRKIKTYTEFGVSASAILLAGLGSYVKEGMIAVMAARIIKALPKLGTAIEKVSPKFIEKMQRKMTGSTREGVALAKLKLTLDRLK